MNQFETPVLIWWIIMVVITLLNLGLLTYSYKILKRKLPQMPKSIQSIRNWQLGLATIYTLVCGFRSIFPRMDVKRVVLWDTWISAVAIGRSAATIAELCFVAQWSWLLWEISKGSGDQRIGKLSKVMLPIIFIAEIFSWYACISGNYLGTAIEESLWAVTATIMLVGLFWARPYYKDLQHRFLNIGIVSCILYVIYMVTVDVPEYIHGWQAAEAANKVYSSIPQGLWEVATQFQVSKAYIDWQYAFVWMTLYFSIAVWMSLVLINSPRMDQGLRK